MRRTSGLACGMVAVLTAVSAGTAQVVNGDFQTGSFPPWVISNTPEGVSLNTAVVPFDIDGPGPLAPSLAARFLVGQTIPDSGPQGVVVSQQVLLTGGAVTTLGFHWAVVPLVNVYGESGGRFELLIDGVPVAEAVAPPTDPPVPSFGRVSADFTPPEMRLYAVAVRITRTVLRGEEVFQYLDNVLASVCRSDWDGSGAVDSDDFFSFLGDFFDGAADFNADGMTTSDDFFAFLSAFFEGCDN